MILFGSDPEDGTTSERADLSVFSSMTGCNTLPWFSLSLSLSLSAFPSLIFSSVPVPPSVTATEFLVLVKTGAYIPGAGICLHFYFGRAWKKGGLERRSITAPTIPPSSRQSPGITKQQDSGLLLLEMKCDFRGNECVCWFWEQLMRDRGWNFTSRDSLVLHS